jgi:hypothetical protein
MATEPIAITALGVLLIWTIHAYRANEAQQAQTRRTAQALHDFASGRWTTLRKLLIPLGVAICCTMSALTHKPHPAWDPLIAVTVLTLIPLIHYRWKENDRIWASIAGLKKSLAANKEAGELTLGKLILAVTALTMTLATFLCTASGKHENTTNNLQTAVHVPGARTNPPPLAHRTYQPGLDDILTAFRESRGR